jgi:uncharacterized protein YndB with AHSA1/START domain
MRLAVVAMAFGLAMLSAPGARADIVRANAGLFAIHAEQTVAANPEQVWAALVRVGDWWDSAHTYSGDAHNLTLDAHAGGCWCERWRGNSVAHARVLMVLREASGARTLRLDAPLGPLQGMGVNAILTFSITPDPAGAKIQMTYRVSGDESLALDQVGPGVNEVIMAQYGRLIHLVTSGSPG